MIKNMLLSQLWEDVPQEIRDKMLTPIPTITSFSLPNDAESAIIAQGKLSYNLNNILKALEGLPLVALALHIGSESPVGKVLTLAHLQRRSETTHLIEIIQPKAQGSGFSYPVEAELQATVFIPDGSAVSSLSCLIVETSQTLFLEQVDSHNWSTHFFLPEGSQPGSYMAYFTAIFSDSPRNTTARVTFEVT